tara:strand:+ start:533 stop:1333 length:801 start_codon:yes stop_codon:yes gene_type:complete
MIDTKNKIDYLTVAYINYDLIFLQIENFKKRLNRESYRFIVVDNTPPSAKNLDAIEKLKNNDVIDVFIEITNSKFSHAIDRKNGIDEGISHGSALEEGLKYCSSDIVCMFDSDFFFLDKNINEYIWDKFNNGYQAVGVTFDMNPFSKEIIDRNPSQFLNVPIIIASFYKNKLAKSASLIVTTPEAEASYQSGGTDVETGCRLRKYIVENKLKTMTWNTEYGKHARETQYHTYKNGKIVGVHGWAGSHASNNKEKMDELRQIIEKIN